MSRTTPLIPNKELTKIAEQRASELCKTNTFSHYGWGKHLGNFSYRGENLYQGKESVKEINKRFLESPLHRKVITNPSYQYFGMATSCNILVEEFGGLNN